VLGSPLLQSSNLAGSSACLALHGTTSKHVKSRDFVGGLNPNKLMLQVQDCNPSLSWVHGMQSNPQEEQY
jgi:hypothetical protein